MCDATTSTSPVGRSGLTLRCSRAATSPTTLTTYSLRRSWAAPVSTSSRATTCTMPLASRRSMKATPPWSRRCATHPVRVTVWPVWVGTQGAGLVGAEHGWSFESGATGVAQSTDVGRLLRTGCRGQALRAGSRHSSLPDGSVTTRQGSSPQSGSSSRPPELDDPRHDGVLVVAGLEPDVEVQPVLGSGRLRGGLGAQLEQHAAARGVAQGGGHGAETACQPDSSAQNAASRAGSALSSGSAAIGPDVDVLRTLLHDAERVALGVGQHHPGHVALADVEVPRAEVEGALHHLGLPGARRRRRGAAAGRGAAARARAGSTDRAPARRAR